MVAVTSMFVNGKIRDGAASVSFNPERNYAKSPLVINMYQYSNIRHLS